jgi:hypothetical protein
MEVRRVVQAIETLLRMSKFSRQRKRVMRDHSLEEDRLQVTSQTILAVVRVQDLSLHH